MSDITERKMWNGREFDITIRESKQPDRSYWIGWIEVVGKPSFPHNSHTVTCLSKSEAEEMLGRWMRKWRN